jgi:hypothetical protein
MSAPVVTVGSNITILAGAIEKYRDVQEMLREATRWLCESTTENEVAERTKLVAEMENSFNRCMLQLIFQAQDYDGPLALHGDSSPGSFFWRHEKSGYHGGLIFHKNHSVDGPVGTWSIHT